MHTTLYFVLQMDAFVTACPSRLLISSGSLLLLGISILSCACVQHMYMVFRWYGSFLFPPKHCWFVCGFDELLHTHAFVLPRMSLSTSGQNHLQHGTDPSLPTLGTLHGPSVFTVHSRSPLGPPLRPLGRVLLVALLFPCRRISPPFRSRARPFFPMTRRGGTSASSGWHPRRRVAATEPFVHFPPSFPFGRPRLARTKRIVRIHT